MSATAGALECGVAARRTAVRAKRRAGIDAVEADDDGRTLTVTFLGKAPRGIRVHNVRVDGGRRITGIRVVAVRLDAAEEPELDDHLRVTVDRTGDRSTYTLSIVDADPHGRPGTRPFPGFDQRYNSAPFTFAPQCPTDVDCAPVDNPVPAVLARPVIDYTARDYASLRRVLLDRMTLTVPGWVERHAPDLQVSLVEVLAYIGDQLSYFTDAVATEAYLDTARRRISVRRHVRLVDYRMHDGCNARTFVTVQTDVDVTLPHDRFRFAAIDVSRLDPRDRPDPATVLSDAELDRLPAGVTVEVFEPLDPGDISLREAHNTIAFWTWGDTECCLAEGATSATLRDSCNEAKERALRLVPGDVLVLEEVRGPRTGAAADADPAHRQAVRLLTVTEGVDPLYEQPVVEVTWAPEDALRFTACLSARGGPDCAELTDVTVARGNAILVDHGRSRRDVESIPVLPADVEPPSCVSRGCATEATRGSAVQAIHALLTEARGGRPLSTDDLAPLVPLVGQAALDRAGLTADAPAPVQVGALEALLAQVSYPLATTRFRPVLRFAPVTQRAPYPDPATVAAAQARALDAIPGRVRARLEELALRHERRPGRDVVAELTVLFGRTPIGDLRMLIDRFDELLAAKLDRLAVLAARAQQGNVLGPDVVWEIRHAWGERYATGLAPDSPALAGAASTVTAQDPRDALPVLRLASGPDVWLPRRDLLASGPRDRDVVGELDDDGRLVLRFGDGLHGVAPPAGGRLDATYRIGNGAAGNVGADAVTHLVVRDGTNADGVTRVRNPLPAVGGTDPEPVDVVRQLAPLSLHRNLLRAVTADDYAALAGQVPGVQRAAAQLRWTGSGTDVVVAVDPLGTGTASATLLNAVARSLEPYRRIGHTVAVEPAVLVPLDVELTVCVDDGFLRAHVVAALRAALGTGRTGFFHPDALTFGEPVRVSRLVAVAAAVPGVVSARVTRLRRLFGPAGDALDAGLLRLGPLEVAECDNAADTPEHGRLSIVAGGGR